MRRNGTASRPSVTTVPGREAITARAEFQPGGSVGRHTHFGEEIGYVADGAVTIEIDNMTKVVKAGEAFMIPAGRPHNASTAGASPSSPTRAGTASRSTAGCWSCASMRRGSRCERIAWRARTSRVYL